MQQTIRLFFLLIFVPFCLAAEDPWLVFEERAVELGEVYQFSTVEHVFPFVNRGSDEVVITGVESILQTGRVNVEPSVIPAGEGGEVRVVQPVGDRLGRTAFRFAVRSTDPGKPEVKLLAEAFVHSAYQPETGQVEIGDVFQDEGKTAVFELVSRAAEELGSIETVEGPEFVEVTALEETQKGQGRRLAVRLLPGAPLGFSTGTVRLRTGVRAQPEYRIEYRATVYGEVVPSENPANLGLMRVDQPAEKVILLRGRAGQPVDIERVEIADPTVSAAVDDCPGEEGCRRLTLSLIPHHAGELRGTAEVFVAGQEEPIPLTFSGMVARRDAVVRDLGVLGDEPIRVEGRRHIKPSERVDQAARPQPAASNPSPPAAEQVPTESAGRDAEEASAKQVVLAWAVRKQDHIFGYLVYRSDQADGPFLRAGEGMVVAPQGPGNIGRYRFVDDDVEPGKTYYYFIELVTRSGLKERLTEVLSKTVPAAVDAAS
ncbi:MAG: DUF1573 domain-containing protein [Acidobacteriota bacterium]